jgi:hypothetical protein
MIRRKIKLREYFLLLLPVFFVLHGYSENYPLIKSKGVLELLLTYLLVFGGLSILFFFLLRSWRKTAVFILLVMCFHFFFGNILNSLKFLFGESFITKYTFILPLSALFFVGAIIYLRRTKREFRRLTLYSNVLLVVLIVLDVFLLTIKIDNPARPASSSIENIFNCKECDKPDIYFIVADEYAGKKELTDIFHFDNSAFEDSLKQRGFFINDSSRSNYNYTAHSMASILSMNYLRNIEGRNKSKKDRNICHQMINKNQTIDLLKLQGYSIKNLSVFMFNNELPPAYSPMILNGKDLLASQTFISRFDHDIRFNLVSKYRIKPEMRRFGNMQLNSINYLFNETQSEASKKNNQPKFVYTHLMMPHYPYLLDKNGSNTAPEMVLEGSQQNQKGYIEYVQYSNKRFLSLIDFILKNSSKPPVIVFMGDHGFRHFITSVPSEYYFMNFNAVYLPSKNYNLFYKGASGVNQFRILFNSIFNQHLLMLKDSTVFVQE